jgi:glycosyltransferase involved in cell wall biosynthesis
MVIAQIITDNREPFRQYDRPTPWFGTAPEALLQGFALIPEVKVHVLGCTQQPMASSPEKLADNIWFHSLHVPKLGWMRTGYQGCVRAVRRKLQEIRPDIVHGQGTERECALSAVFSGFLNVLTIHGNMRSVAKVSRSKPVSFSWLAARLESFVLPRTQGVVCITRYTENAVKELARQMWLVPNAVDDSFFQVSPEPEFPPVMLFAGNVLPYKNQNAFIRALDAVAKQHRFKLCFIGRASRGDAYADEFFQLVAERPWCSYEGFADRTKLKDYLRRASIVVLPSLEDNCPMVVLEGMAAGVPVMAARVGGVPDLIEEGVTGLFCDPTRAESMAAATTRLLADAQLRARVRDVAKERAWLRFHPKAIAQRHVEIYREVLRG